MVVFHSVSDHVCNAKVVFFPVFPMGLQKNSWLTVTH